jgi:hypothetical protein
MTRIFTCISYEKYKSAKIRVFPVICVLLHKTVYEDIIKLFRFIVMFITFATENLSFFGNIIYFILLIMNRKKGFLGFALLVMAYAAMFAQETDIAKPQILTVLSQADGQSGQIEIIQPVQIENLLKMQIANNRKQEGIPGYRINIFSDSGQTARQKAYDTRSNFMKNFPDIEAYLKYVAPNFQITVGDFRTKNEALRERKKIEKLFPRAFIVSEIIDISK